MDTKIESTPDTHKVRRDVVGGKRGAGHEYQAQCRLVTRPSAGIEVVPTTAALTSVAGLPMFGAFVRGQGVDVELRSSFGHLKSHFLVAYPMDAQMRLLMDANVAGEARVFGVENLAADPVFVHLAGGTVPGIDTLYRDLCRFGPTEIEQLERIVARHGLRGLGKLKLKTVHLNIDTTVEPLFGSQEGALPGSNPHYHGRPSYHPVLAYITETGTVVGAALRPGDTSFGEAEVPLVERWIARLRQAVGAECRIYVRIDAAGDCTEIMTAIEEAGAYFVTKARMTPDLCRAVARIQKWTSTEWDGSGKPLEQVAEVKFQRTVWRKSGTPFRVAALRSRIRETGKQLFLWSDLDYTVRVYITNDDAEPVEDLAVRYDKRAGIEPAIGELKYDWAIGKIPSKSFDANHVMFLLKLLSFNLFRRFADACAAPLRGWRTAWLRRAIIGAVGRLVRSGHRMRLVVPLNSPLLRLAPVPPG